jgi:serine protein kinase
MNILEQLEAAEQREQNRWKGTFKEFLRLFETGEYPSIGHLAHQRIENMITSAGTDTQDYFGRARAQYKFFEESLYGIEGSIDQIMSYVHAAARKTETARRMLLLYGPPSSGKSDLVVQIKRGLETYSRTREGAIFALQGSEIHESPFLLVPDDLRKEFRKQYGITIEGQLSPHTAWRLQNEFNGKFMEYPIEQIFISESRRIGIGTWLPQDPKSQDQSELVGGIDYARIQEVGNEGDPRAYNLNGELEVANRGIMEFIEGLKADERFLRVLLTATQEKTIKAPRFGLISVDTFIIMHTNEEEFKNFMAERKYEAYHDRMVIVRVPYNLGIKNEVKIYEKLLHDSDLSLKSGDDTSGLSVQVGKRAEAKDIHIAPHTLEAAAMFAVLTRLEPPKDSDLTLVTKMKLYDNQHVKGHKPSCVHDMYKASPREGMFGISPRFVIDQINASIAQSAEESKNYVTALDVLRQLLSGVQHRDSFSKEEKGRFEQLIDASRNEWNDLLRNDIQKAFFLSFEEEAKNLCDNYLTQIEMALRDEKQRDPITDKEIELDEKLMESIEGHLEISKSGVDDFRNEVLHFFGIAARKGKKVDYTQHAQLREAIQKQLFEERQGTIRMTVSTRNPDPEGLRRLNDVIDRMVEQQGYTAGSANELLKYATAHLFDK